MLLRSDGDGVLAIGQPAHAWVSGQLARGWGNARFGTVAPWEEVCLAAEQHDVGMAAWDLQPAWNPGTGLPRSFMEMALETHLTLWREGPRRLQSQSRYAALLSSMHGMRLYEMRDLSQLPDPEADQIRDYLDGEREFQAQLLATLGAPAVANVQHGSDLLWTWDYMSLALLLGWAPVDVSDVPTSDGTPVTVRIEPLDAHRLTVTPWPFSDPHGVRIRCEGRRLAGGYESAQAFTQAWFHAPWESVNLSLTPG